LGGGGVGGRYINIESLPQKRYRQNIENWPKPNFTQPVLSNTLDFEATRCFDCLCDSMS
jgi:hypothetical protein